MGSQAPSSLRARIEARLGFFPPFFLPAEDDPRVLSHLWQQTIDAYLDSPLPTLFCEQLSAYLSRFCAVPYCMICHSCSLRPLGMRACQVLELLETSPPHVESLGELLDTLERWTGAPDAWPSPGSAEDEALFGCAVLLFLQPEKGAPSWTRLRERLGSARYNALVALLGYVRTCHTWVETHPELVYEVDLRAQQHLGPLLSEEPCLADFFMDYRQRVRNEHQRRELLLLEAAEAGRHAEALAHTLRQQTEALQHSEASLRLAVESASLAVWDFVPTTGALCLDARCKALFGLPPEAQVGYDAFLACIHPEDRARVHAAIQQALARGGSGEFREEYRTLGLEDGVERWVAARGRGFFNARGEAVRFIGTAVNVTERKRTELDLRFLAEASEALASSMDVEDMLRRVARMAVPALADGCIIDVRAEPTGAVRRLAIVHARPDTERLLTECLRQDASDLDACLGVDRVLRTGRPERVPDLPSAAPHLPRELGLKSCIVVPMQARGRVLGAITLVHGRAGRRFDEPCQRLAEELAHRAAVAMDNALLYHEAQKAVGLRDAFLQVAAHELRTPITSLQLNAQCLLADMRDGRTAPPPERMMPKLQGMVRSMSRLGALVSTLLDVARLSSGRLELYPEELDLAEVVRQFAEGFQPEAARAGCALSIRAPDPLITRGDRLRLEQVLGNLLSNAVKYGAGRPVEVELYGSGPGVFLRVRDQGIGIEPAAQARIFERFERAVSGRHYGGFGMGLWITREIVEAMGGTLSVRSLPGQGATFTVELTRWAEEAFAMHAV
jgi:PAS domain S-box-containing protein